MARRERFVRESLELERIFEKYSQLNAIRDTYDKKNWSPRAMDVDRFMMIASLGFAIVLGLFVLWGPSPRPKRKKGKVVGINNLGYTCFLNSLLQALAACPTFIQWLAEQRKNKDESFSDALFSVLSKINGLEEDFYVTPIKIISSLGSLWNFGPGQQDTHELFHVVLNALEAEIQTTNRNGLSDALRSVSCNDIAAKDSNKPGIILARSSQQLYTMSCSDIPSVSIEMHPFSGLSTSQLQCTDCKWKSSVRYDKFETLSLPLPPFTSQSEQQYTLEELLTRFVDSEIIHDVQCDRCSSRCMALKTLSLGKLPKCLCLHISRTAWSSSGVLTKRDDHVTFPQTLVLDPYTYKEMEKRNTRGDARYFGIDFTTQGKYKYRLCAVIEHRGRVDIGHFVCFRSGNKTNQWLYTSDVDVENVSLTQVLLANPYMLFYERIKTHTNSRVVNI